MEDNPNQDAAHKTRESLNLSASKGLQENAFKGPPIRQTNNQLKVPNTGSFKKKGPGHRSNQERLLLETLENIEDGSQTQIDGILGSKKPKVSQC